METLEESEAKTTHRIALSSLAPRGGLEAQGEGPAAVRGPGQLDDLPGREHGRSARPEQERQVRRAVLRPLSLGYGLIHG